MTGPAIKTPRKRYPSDDRGSDRRRRPSHMLHDIGPAIEEADFRPRIFGNPEQAMAAAFIEVGRDYSGAADPAKLRAMIDTIDDAEKASQTGHRRRGASRFRECKARGK